MGIKPALFSGPMVRALLEGRKTMTRRILKPQPFIDQMGNFCAPDRSGKLWNWGQHMDGTPCVRNYTKKCAPYKTGDLLWVREAWQALAEHDHLKPSDIPVGSDIIHTASRPDAPWDSRKRPSMFMCRWMSRITLPVLDVKIERVQDITKADAIAEGLEWVAPTWGIYGLAQTWNGNAVVSYAALWNHINGPGAWDRNDWVAAYTFEPIFKNVDEVGGPDA